MASAIPFWRELMDGRGEAETRDRCPPIEELARWRFPGSNRQGDDEFRPKRRKLRKLLRVGVRERAPLEGLVHRRRSIQARPASGRRRIVRWVRGKAAGEARWSRLSRPGARSPRSGVCLFVKRERSVALVNRCVCGPRLTRLGTTETAMT